MMCNHQSSLDCLVIAKDAPRPTATLAKKSLLYVPLFGWAAWLAGTIFIERSSSSAINVMKKLVADLKKKKANVWIFPEGTRCQNDSMLPFKKGGFHLAIEAQIPVVPVVVGNCRNFIDIPNKIFNSGILRVKVLQPIETTGMTKDDVTKLTNSCRDLMLKEYAQMMEDYKQEYVNMRPLPNSVKHD
ncbi:1-acyl-sn-glycerol-3-phosphate acyltransferase alpha-like [Rhopilema esculentum]|uniref:1-acyl-sn-glycerol-3-phosphate acyltransferase alpha-like n=1 Tax=Rhopilema esculentum TaxID=499914 RepID=UPI0031E33F17